MNNLNDELINNLKNMQMKITQLRNSTENKINSNINMDKNSKQEFFTKNYISSKQEDDKLNYLNKEKNGCQIISSQNYYKEQFAERNKNVYNGNYNTNNYTNNTNNNDLYTNNSNDISINSNMVIYFFILFKNRMFSI